MTTDRPNTGYLESDALIDLLAGRHDDAVGAVAQLSLRDQRALRVAAEKLAIIAANEPRMVWGPTLWPEREVSK